MTDQALEPESATPSPTRRPRLTARAGGVRRRLARVSVRGVLLGACGAWIAFLLIEKVLSGRVWVGEAVGTVPPFLFALVPLTLLAGAAAVRGSRMPTTALAALGLLLGLDQAGLNFDAFFASGRVPAGAVHIVSWNTEAWDQNLGGTRQQFYTFLTSQNADVYLLQEYQHVESDHMTPLPIDDLAKLRSEFPGYYIAVLGGLITISRFPIIAQPAIGPEKSLPPGADWSDRWQTDKVLRTDLAIGGSVVSVYNVHMPVWNQMADRMLSGAFFSAMHSGFDRRRTWFADLAGDVAADHEPVIVAGDFDTSPAMADLNGLRSELADAQGASTSFYPEGWQQGGVMPFWRTDWAFTGHGAFADRYLFVTPGRLSDHSMQDFWVSVNGAH